MGTALRGVLSVDERVVFLAILVGMRKGYLNVFALHVDDRVEAVVGHVVGEQVFQTVARKDAAAIEDDGQSGVQIGIVTEHRFHDVIVELVVLEQCFTVVGLEIDVSTILVVGLTRFVVGEHTTFEVEFAHLSVAERLYFEMTAQEVHGLHAYAIQSHRLLEGLRIVLTTSVQLAYGFDELALRDASAIVAH